MLTLEAGTLKVASAFPDPPFELGTSEAPAGFDVELMRAVCRERKLELQLIRYAGDDFNGIFAGLAEGRYDAVIRARRSRRSDRRSCNSRSRTSSSTKVVACWFH